MISRLQLHGVFRKNGAGKASERQRWLLLHRWAEGDMMLMNLALAEAPQSRRQGALGMSTRRLHDLGWWEALTG